MLGFTFDYGPFVAFVSEWQENGTATEFVEGKSLDTVCKIVRLVNEAYWVLNVSSYVVLHLVWRTFTQRGLYMEISGV